MKKTTQIEYTTYRSMLRNCYPKNTTTYYEKKNIKVCDEWLVKDGFWVFLKDVGRKPTNKHKLYRKDSNKDFCKENCIWSVSPPERKNSIYLTYKGKRSKLIDLCKEHNIAYSSAYKYYKEDMAFWQILKKLNKGRGRRVVYNKKLYTIKELCEKYNLNLQRTYWRISNGWSIEETVEQPNQHNKQTREQKNTFMGNKEERMKKTKENIKRRKYKDSDTYKNYQYFSKKNSGL